jgi:putative holliday junction resolvase
MARILAIDYGLKRTGLAVTDPLQIIAGGLGTVNTTALMPFLEKYIAREPVEKLVVGDPRNNDGTDTHATAPVMRFIGALKKKFPHIPVVTADERFTSRMARKSMLEMGLPKKKRQNKALVDEIAAVIILQEYLDAHGADT